MRSIMLLVTLTLITGVAVVYYLKARKSANELKDCHSTNQSDKTTKENEAEADAA